MTYGWLKYTSSSSLMDMKTPLRWKTVRINSLLNEVCSNTCSLKIKWWQVSDSNLSPLQKGSGRTLETCGSGPVKHILNFPEKGHKQRAPVCTKWMTFYVWAKENTKCWRWNLKLDVKPPLLKASSVVSIKIILTWCSRGRWLPLLILI